MITHTTTLLLEAGEFSVAFHRLPGKRLVSMSHGNVEDDVPLVRIHSSCLFGESFRSLDCDCRQQLNFSLSAIGGGNGVVVYSYAEGRGIGLENKVQAMELQRVHSIDSVDAFLQLGFHPDERSYVDEALALHDLKLPRRIRVITQNPAKIAALERSGFEITEVIGVPITITPQNRLELETKKAKLGHFINGL